jgi:hypothetical protein
MDNKENEQKTTKITLISTTHFQKTRYLSYKTGLIRVLYNPASEVIPYACPATPQSTKSSKSSSSWSFEEYSNKNPNSSAISALKAYYYHLTGKELKT